MKVRPDESPLLSPSQASQDSFHKRLPDVCLHRSDKPLSGTGNEMINLQKTGEVGWGGVKERVPCYVLFWFVRLATSSQL